MKNSVNRLSVDTAKNGLINSKIGQRKISRAKKERWRKGILFSKKIL